MIWDPNELELEETETIGIFEPGKIREESLDLQQTIKVVGYTILGLVLMTIVAIPLLLVMIFYGLVEINIYTGSVNISPLATAILGVLEILLVVPPIHYIRSRGLSLRSIGIKVRKPAREIALGVMVGGLMIILNIVMSWALYQIPGIPVPDDSSMFSAVTISDVIALSLVMMLIVGPTEEILYRGFLQRRLETYYYGRHRDFRLWSLVVTSFIFALTHLDLAGLGIRFVLGLILGYFAQKQEYSLLGPSVAHGLNNTLIIVLSFLGF